MEVKLIAMQSDISKKKLFEDIIGQEFAKTFLNAIIQKDRLSTAYLFSGPQGVGKKLTALRFLEGLLTTGLPSARERRRLESYNHPDLLWIEPTYQNQGRLISKSQAIEEGLNTRNPPQIRLEQIREVGRFLAKSPLEAKFGIVVIEAVEKMAESAANALLKTLEEPKNGILILITSRPEKLLQTIHSRCQKIPFYALSQKNFELIVNQIINEKDLKVSNLLNQKEMILISNGSPGAFIENIQVWNSIPETLWPKLKELPKNSIDAITLAKLISEELNVENQIWLINWIQYNLWNKANNSMSIKRLENLREQLISFVQPRLAWEVALLEIKDN